MNDKGETELRQRQGSKETSQTLAEADIHQPWGSMAGVWVRDRLLVQAQLQLLYTLFQELIFDVIYLTSK